jgi:hypothetical protein
MYLFFNESDKAEARVATVAGKGQAQAWDMATGEIHPLSAAAAEGDSVRFPLVLGPYETKVVVVGPLPGGVAAAEPSMAGGAPVAELGGDWTVELNGQPVTGPLKSWEEMGTRGFGGPATYRKQFTAAAPAAGKRVYLEVGDVHDYARVKLNGKELEAHAWQPYRWDITSAVKAGTNDLEIEVRAMSGGRGGGGGGAPPAAGRGGRGPAVYGAVGGIPAARGPAAPTVSGLLGPVRVVAR